MNDPYQPYSEEDFVEDIYFRQWVTQPDRESNAFWQQWLVAHPEKRMVVENARQLLLSIRFDEKPLSDERVANLWQHIEAQIDEVPAKSYPRHEWVNWPVSVFFAWRRIAAVLALLVLSSVGYFLTQLLPGQISYQTGYGETRTIVLPDSSTVVLNAHSRLRFAPDWTHQTVREVWLEGEAFFYVKRKAIRQPGQATATPTKFHVYTEDLRVEVLGTQFNVARRTGNTEVVLQSGKVQLDLNTAGKAGSVLMEPGEWAAFSADRQAWVKRPVNAEARSAWRNNKWILEDTPLSEVAAMLENTYGLTVTLANKRLRHRKVTGVIPTENLEMLLDALSLTLKVHITRHENHLRITE